ncbi:MAG: bacterial Ig-like domain-containing protein, partial [Bacilli bacterium]|nr:bacterial Ig-like domain-containing protein [Bacilli bacterium]
MNKLFTKITSLALGAAMMIGVGAAVGSKKASPAEATDTTVTLAPRNVTSVADKDDDNGKTWAMASDAQGFTSNSSYVHAGSGSKTVSYLRFSTTAYNSNTIKSISLYGAAAANSSATLKIYVGGTLKEESEVLGNNASSGGTELTWTNTDSSSGEIKVEVSRSSATKKALYFNQVIVTITSGPTKLATPTGVSYDSTNQEVKWNSVSNASSYKFSSDNGSSYTSTSTNLYFDVSSFTDGTTYNCKVVAVGDGSSYSDSDAASYSFTKTATPSYTSVSVTGGSQQGTEKGSAFIQCSATATGTNIPESPSYTWYVTETNTYGTTTSVTNKASIDNTGKVTFDDSCTVYVWALAPDGSTHNTSGYAATASELVDAKGSQNNPYTVAEARYALDNGGKVADVYAKGIVSSIVTAYSTQYKNVTYNLSDDGTTSSDQLQAFRLSSETDPGVKVGDVITVTGSLTIYGSTYEFGADCTLYRHAQIQSLTVTTSPENEYDAGETFNPAGLVVSATYNNGESNHSFSYANHESNFGFDPGTSTPLTSTVETVTITYGNGEVSFPIEVTVAPAVISVEVDPSSKTAYFEDEFNISVSVTTEGGASAAITWSIEDNSSLISIKNGTATDTSVTIVVGTTVGTAYVRATSNFDNQVYARCKVDVKDPDALVDTINRELTGVSSGAGYSNWSGKSDSTSAVYAGNTAGGNDSVQVNSSYGFYNTASAGYVREIEITFDSHTSTSSRTVTVYGYTTARSSIDKTGTVLGSATYNGTDAT